MRLLVVDPGKTTGVMVATISDGALKIEYANEFPSSTRVLWLIHKHQPDLVVIEDFILRKDKAAQLSGDRMVASEVIGAVKAYCSERNIPVTTQPASVKDTIHKSLLVRTRLWQATMGLPHARDAARHLLAYCLKHRLVSLEKLEGGSKRQ